MEWIKRNAGLVIGGVVALALLGLAGYYLLTKINADREVDASVRQATDQLQSLVTRDPHPGNEKIDNISAAKEEAKKLEEFVGEVRKLFPPAETGELTSRELGALLDITINELQSEAERSGVEIPKDYWFTFSAQRTAMSFQQDAIQPLAARLADIRAICDVLFDAKVSALIGIRRAAVPGENTMGSQDYLTNKVTTNQWAIVAPYEVTFKSFTSELADVLEGFVKSKDAIIVKSLAVRPASQAAEMHEFTDAYGPSYSPYGGPGPYGNRYMNPYGNRYGSPQLGAGGRPGGGMDAALARRYGLGAPRAPVAPPQAPAPSRPGRRGTLVDEKPLSITLVLDVVKLIPPPEQRVAQASRQ